ncbi:MAG: hypothetical protein IPL79_09180 [Myxococcales bacterium]|nr:hypothetical protein [Myxococcales bacterium]
MIFVLGSVLACASRQNTNRVPYQTNQFLSPAFTCAMPRQEYLNVEDLAAPFEQYVAPIFVAPQAPGATALLDLRAEHVCKLKTAFELPHVPAKRGIEVLYAVLTATTDSLTTAKCEEIATLAWSRTSPPALPQFDYANCARLDDARVLAAETIGARSLIEQEPIWSWVVQANLRTWATSGADSHWLRGEHLDAHVLAALHPYLHVILRQRLDGASADEPDAGWLEAQGVLITWIRTASSVKSHGIADIHGLKLLRGRLLTTLQLAKVAGLEHEAMSLIAAFAEVPAGSTLQSANSVASHLRGHQLPYELCNEPSNYDVDLYMIQHLILRLSVLDVGTAGLLKREVCADAELFRAFLTLANLGKGEHRLIHPAMEVLKAHGAVLAATTFAAHENVDLAAMSTSLIASAARQGIPATDVRRAIVESYLVVIRKDVHREWIEDLQLRGMPMQPPPRYTHSPLDHGLCTALFALGRSSNLCE